ncbi:Bifunctional dethiobiotin synthetase/7,8-diamino-pelargonic acid aminotransferase-like protein [Hapsidospora chrysogenum ATCC 11550]|uniref:Bifunctional dethiobiotin synthetase/7,8-diamino-pelargonic acid aminotransferase-like protein n=1 Tax=Hapsidospora chrysogenum (strain ATCC 11550 / CBS 779.69 / DSM 880 / IAM 14645 / JCM 23072 / IMI 49137) TaxID=857340 RepID=A0A086T8I4_HAPC1|nr:Bifunctional dethiobiotin synthetase/7,8-diamino-pelargonic acid aminotransferase-like protein [Hapsidospora chrysogenum ATCC 11550]
MKSPVASLLWRSLRVYQVFGANTDVGKTVFTALLARAAKDLPSKEAVSFLKPVSTGPADEADDYHIRRFAAGVAHRTLFQYDIPVSPHAAALASGKETPSDEYLLAKCRDFAVECAARGSGWLFLETAGGVHSPGPSGSTQADMYIPLRIPVVLIGDSRLGGISQTISAFESLHIRGYHVQSVLLFQDSQYENHVFLADYFNKHHGIPVVSIPAPPERAKDADQDAEAMAAYYARRDCQTRATQVLEHLDRRHGEHLASIESMAAEAHKHIWYPFTQQSLLKPGDITTIDSAHGDYFQTWTPPTTKAAQANTPVLKSSFDGSASWWSQGLGHSNPKLTLAAAYAAGRYGHVMFPGYIHRPAMDLASTLLDGMRNPRLNRVFYSDNGSTGTEVAVKMGLRAARLRYGWGTDQKLGVLGLRGGYHGDTIGAMDMAEPCAFNEKIEWYEGKGYWFDYPTVLCKDGRWTVTVNDELSKDIGEDRAYRSLGDIFDIETREQRGEHHRYEEYISKVLVALQQRNLKFGSVIIEPIVLGAGGMELVDPLFQRALVNVVRQSPHLFSSTTHPAPRDARDWSGLPIIFDEVFTGLYRLGRFTPSSFLGVCPDISVHAKLLTGGLLPLCATLASEHIFDVFGSPDKTDALLHGHSYTAHPVGCQVALTSLREMQAMERRGDWQWARAQGWQSSDDASQSSSADNELWSWWPRDFVEMLSRQTERVAGVWSLGSVLAIHLRDDAGAGYSSNAAQGLRDALAREREGAGGPWNVQARVLGNVLYVMASQSTKEESIRQIVELLQEALV